MEDLITLFDENVFSLLINYLNSPVAVLKIDALKLLINLMKSTDNNF